MFKIALSKYLPRDGRRLIDAERKWKADAYCCMLKWTSPRLYKIFQSKGARYAALFKQQIAATYLALPKKHIPMLFHNGGDSGIDWAATLYFDKATSKSWWVCIIEPAASIAFEPFGSKAKAVPKNSNAAWWFPIWIFSRPSVVFNSGLSGNVLKMKIISKCWRKISLF